MSIERTLSIVKPDGVSRNLIGEVYRRFEQVGLKVVAARMAQLSQAEAEGFYAVHRERPFFKDLVRFMISGPVMIQVLEGEGAIAKHRDVMGATDPKKAAKGTIRADLATSIDENMVHGSDAAETATREIAYFFRERQTNESSGAAARRARSIRRRASEREAVSCPPIDEMDLSARLVRVFGDERFGAGLSRAARRSG
jgi:nucleoside-diphosphate kinase